MLGNIIAGLIEPATAGVVVAAVARPELAARIRKAAETSEVPVGALIAAKVRHVVEHGGEDIWLDLLSQMAGSPQPGAAAVDRVLAHAFPDPVRVRVRAHAA